MGFLPFKLLLSLKIYSHKSISTVFLIYNEVLIISDGLEAKTEELSAGFDHFMAWKSADGKKIVDSW